jgi:hypothetical protein
MQHDRGCVCQECTSTSTTDTVLVGILIISGVVIAISTGSKWFVAAAVLVLVGLVARKLRKDRPSRAKG